MIKHYLTIILLLICYHSYSQFTDDMESYTDGQPISGGHWTDYGCGGGPGCEIMSTSIEAHSGTLSGLIPGDNTTDAILDLGNKIFGVWYLEFWMYVPSGNEAYWGIKGCVPICAEDWWIHFFFNQDNNNPGVGLVNNSALGDVFFDFPHDEWFKVEILVDISMGIAVSRWQLHINDVEIIECDTPYTTELGEIPASFGGINFFSISVDNTYYVDDFVYMNTQYPCVLGSEEYIETSISIYPNPAQDLLRIDNTSNTEITSIKMYDLLGRLVLEENNNFNQIDVSQLNSGVLFVKIETEQGIIIKKIIKE